MNEKQKEKCKEWIEEGKWNFVFKHGVLYWGFPMFLFFILLEKFILEYKIDSSDVTFNIILWGIAGLIVGLWSWRSINKEVKKK